MSREKQSKLHLAARMDAGSSVLSLAKFVHCIAGVKLHADKCRWPDRQRDRGPRHLPLQSYRPTFSGWIRKPHKGLSLIPFTSVWRVDFWAGADLGFFFSATRETKKPYRANKLWKMLVICQWLSYNQAWVQQLMWWTAVTFVFLWIWEACTRAHGSDPIPLPFGSRKKPYL